jgi:hypothetical protein
LRSSAQSASMALPGNSPAIGLPMARRAEARTVAGEAVSAERQHTVEVASLNPSRTKHS